MDEITQGLEDHELALTATILTSEYGKVLFSQVEKKLKKERGKYEGNPKVSDNPINEDFRVLLGWIQALKWVLDRPLECQQLIEQKGE